MYDTDTDPRDTPLRHVVHELHHECDELVLHEYSVRFLYRFRRGRPHLLRVERLRKEAWRRMPRQRESRR